MKTTLLILLVAAFFMVSCEKGGLAPAGVFGKWELRRMYGGFGYRDSVYKPGNGTFYVFNSDSTYSSYTKGTLTSHGVFHFKKNGIQWSGTSFDELIFDNNSSGELVTLKDTLLTFGTTITDGIATDYVKIK